MFDNDMSMSGAESLKAVVESVIAEMYFTRPGIIKKWDAEKNVADVQIAIKAKKPVIDGKVDYEDQPIILHVPIAIGFSVGAGLFSTRPIRENDDCTLFFSDRMLDMYWRTGKMALPEECGVNGAYTRPRQHDMTDAFFVPGIITKPNAIKDWNNDRIEVRDKDREKYISFGNDAIEATDGEAKAIMKDGAVDVEAPNGIRLTDGTASITIKDGKISFADPNGMYVDAPNFKLDDLLGHISATFRAQRIQSDTSVNAGSDLTTSGGFSAEGHRHKGVETGGGTSGTYV